MDIKGFLEMVTIQLKQRARIEKLEKQGGQKIGLLSACEDFLVIRDIVGKWTEQLRKKKAFDFVSGIINDSGEIRNLELQGRLLSLFALDVFLENPYQYSYLGLLGGIRLDFWQRTCVINCIEFSVKLYVDAVRKLRIAQEKTDLICHIREGQLGNAKEELSRVQIPLARDCLSFLLAKMFMIDGHCEEAWELILSIGNNEVLDRGPLYAVVIYHLLDKAADNEDASVAISYATRIEEVFPRTLMLFSVAQMFPDEKNLDLAWEATKDAWEVTRASGNPGKASVGSGMIWTSQSALIRLYIQSGGPKKALQKIFELEDIFWRKKLLRLLE